MILWEAIAIATYTPRLTLLLSIGTKERVRVMSKLICHAEDCDNSTSETFFHCEQHGGEDGEGENNG
jgi:hypothetical protein